MKRRLCVLQTTQPVGPLCVCVCSVVAELQSRQDKSDWPIHIVLPLPDGLFASGSHVGELILWDANDWHILAYEHILWEESQADAQSEIRLGSPKPCEMSIRHLSTNGTVRRGRGHDTPRGTTH